VACVVNAAAELHVNRQVDLAAALDQSRE